MNLVLLGAPGAGKGTQSQFIIDEFGLPHIPRATSFALPSRRARAWVSRPRAIWMLAPLCLMSSSSTLCRSV